MIRVRQVKVPINNDDLKKYVALKLKINENEIISLKINKKSVDARKKDNIYFVYEVDVTLKNENEIKHNNDIFEAIVEKYKFLKTGINKLNNRPVIVGSGPSGLFCAYLLAMHGYNPLIIERGERIEDRVTRVSSFWEDGILNCNSNVQFGEGGAGTFSDGKLNTLVKDKNCRMKKVFEIFKENGAPEEIMYMNNPHIGTDLLRDVIINIRNNIIKMGGEFRYNSLMTDISIEDNKINSITINNEEVIDTDVLVLAIGHSSRDTYELLYSKNIEMESKPFAVGIRIQHPQELINKNQYGDAKLPPASYKLTYNKGSRGVYSFCMCPGGYVVNSSSENKGITINGMSNHDRNSGIANSAIVVSVSPDDYGNHPLDGIYFQRKFERKAYEIGDGKVPVQLYKDFKKNIPSMEINDNHRFKGDINPANLNEIFPNYINDALKEAIDYFDTKINGFGADDVILAAPESRTSSPVRILRNDNFESNIIGIYPIGEGAGYSGGITTSAIDGIKCAEAIASEYYR